MTRKTRLRRLALAAAVVALCALTSACGSDGSSAAAAHSGAGANGFRGAALPPRTQEVDFALHDQDGQLVRLSAQRGRYVLLTFLYTHCRDVCPLIANSLSGVLRQLGPAQDKVRIIAVSVDPKGDTPASVRAFIKAHRLPAQFRYLTGSRDQLERIWAQYNSSVMALGNDQFRHDAYITLIDTQGNQRAVYKPPASPSAVLHDLQMLLRAGRA